MKTPPRSILAIGAAALLALSLAPRAHAADGHDHDKPVAAPHGGRVLELDGGHAEFLILDDRKVQVTFYTDEMKPVAPAGQVVAVTAQAPGGKTALEFEKGAESFVSKTPLPEGNGYLVVLQIQSNADAKPRNFRIKLDLTHCGGCGKAEYACTCEGH